jgi:hypothetical protein
VCSPKWRIDVNDLGQSLGMSFSSAFEEAILSGNKFRDVLKGLLDDILRILVRTTISAPLASAAGDFFSGMFGGARASGGPVSAGTTYLVGEKGPELFTPDASGAILDHKKTNRIIETAQALKERAQEKESSHSAFIRGSSIAGFSERITNNIKSHAANFSSILPQMFGRPRPDAPSLLALEFAGFRASGGPVRPGKAYVVGEKGPELFAPSTAGTIIPGGGGVQVNIINNVGAEISTRQVDTPQGPGIEVMIDRAVAQKLSERGSASNTAMRSTFGARQALTGR